jgi:hypothetical protein
VLVSISRNALLRFCTNPNPKMYRRSRLRRYGEHPNPPNFATKNISSESPFFGTFESAIRFQKFKLCKEILTKQNQDLYHTVIQIFKNFSRSLLSLCNKSFRFISNNNFERIEYS